MTRAQRFGCAPQAYPKETSSNGSSATSSAGEGGELVPSPELLPLRLVTIAVPPSMPAIDTNRRLRVFFGVDGCSDAPHVYACSHICDEHPRTATAGDSGWMGRCAKAPI